MRVKSWILTLGGAALVVALIASLVWPGASEVESDAARPAAPLSAAPSTPGFDGAARQLPVVAGSVESAPSSLLESTRVRPPALGAASGPRLAGTVVREADGTALVCARVVALARMDDARGGELALGDGVETDANGVFEFPQEVASGSPAGFFVQWHCRDSGGFDAQQRIPLSAELGPLDALSLRLDTGWILTVHVRDEDGRPVSGAYVRSRDEHGRSDSDSSTPDRFLNPTEADIRAAAPSRDNIPTDDTGDFALRDLRWLERPLPVVVFGEGYETKRFRVPTPPRGTWSAEVDVVLTPEEPGGH